MQYKKICACGQEKHAGLKHACQDRYVNRALLNVNLYARFTRALEIIENLENHEKRFQLQGKIEFEKTLNNHGKIMEF